MLGSLGPLFRRRARALRQGLCEDTAPAIEPMARRMVALVMPAKRYGLGLPLRTVGDPIGKLIAE